MKTDYEYRYNFVKAYCHLIKECAIEDEAVQIIEDMTVIDEGRTVFVSRPTHFSTCVNIHMDSLAAILEDLKKALVGEYHRASRKEDYNKFAHWLGEYLVMFGSEHCESCGVESIESNYDGSEVVITFRGGGKHRTSIAGMGILEAGAAIARACY